MGFKLGGRPPGGMVRSISVSESKWVSNWEDAPRGASPLPRHGGCMSNNSKAALVAGES